MLVTYYFNANVRVLKMRGFPTKGLANGDEFALLSLAKVTGTSSYATVGGATNTVHVVEPLSDSEIAALALQEEKEEQDRQMAKRLAKIAANRSWKVTGRSLHAKLTGIRDDGVELTGTDRRKAIYALDDLSKPDQEYVKSVQGKLNGKTKDDERDKKLRDLEQKLAKAEAGKKNAEQNRDDSRPEKDVAKANDDHIVYLSDLKESSVDVWVYIPGFGFGKKGRWHRFGPAPVWAPGLGPVWGLPRIGAPGRWAERLADGPI